MENNDSYFIKRLKSFGYAFKGIYKLFRYEANAQIHLLAVFVVVSAGLFLNISTLEWCIIVLTMSVVIAAEGFNSSIEKLVDSIYKEQNPTAGTIKDIAAGAVLICAIAAVIIACLIFIPYIIKL